MQRMVQWWLSRELRLFCWINQRWHHQRLDEIMNRITHLGGATATVSFSLFLSLCTSGMWKTTGLQCLLSLIVSHLPVAAIKKTYPRRRPYLVLPDANICRNPLRDHSFPSGHTTAIFSVTVPLVLAFPALGTLLLPLAAAVGFSRIYLGLHYPSDVLAGCLIGSGCAAAVTVLV